MFERFLTNKLPINNKKVDILKSNKYFRDIIL